MPISILAWLHAVSSVLLSVAALLLCRTPAGHTGLTSSAKLYGDRHAMGPGCTLHGVALAQCGRTGICQAQHACLQSETYMESMTHALTIMGKRTLPVRPACASQYAWLPVLSAHASMGCVKRSTHENRDLSPEQTITGTTPESHRPQLGSSVLLWSGAGASPAFPSPTSWPCWRRCAPGRPRCPRR